MRAARHQSEEELTVLFMEISGIVQHGGFPSHALINDRATVEALLLALVHCPAHDALMTSALSCINQLVMHGSPMLYQNMVSLDAGRVLTSVLADSQSLPARASQCMAALAFLGPTQSSTTSNENDDSDMEIDVPNETVRTSVAASSTAKQHEEETDVPLSQLAAGDGKHLF